MVYVIDGYNVIHALPLLERRLETNLKSARDALTELCLRIQSVRGDVERVVIVFDGDSAFRDLPPENFPGVEIVFTESSEDADDRILDVLRDFASSRRACVVSNDHYVLNNARAFGASVLGASAFEALSRPKKKHRPESGGEDAMPDRAARELTEDYKRYLGID